MGLPNIKKRLQQLSFVVIPLALLAAAQGYTVSQTTFEWYESAEARAKIQALDVIFVGSSRVKAAIDTTAFEAVVASEQGRHAEVVNFGVGGATMRQHLLGVRNLIEEHPMSMEGTVVFVETFTAVPGSMNGWFFEFNPRLLAEVMRLKDVGPFWRTGYSMEQKLSVTMRCLLFKLRPFFWKERIRQTVIDGGARQLMAMAKGLGLAAHPRAADGPPVDLVEGGGIRTDQKGVALVRQQAIETQKGSVEEGTSPEKDMLPTTVAAWDQSEVGELVRLIKKQGGSVCFFEAPLHSIYKTHYRRVVSEAARASFAAAVDKWRTPWISVDIGLFDADFPDISHLRKSMAPRFTEALAKRWFDTR